MRLIVLICLFLITQSCKVQIIGITDDYKKLSEKQKSIIKPIDNFEKVDTGRIYTINAIQLKNEIKKYPKSLVYVFTNVCSAEFCKPLNFYEDFAKRHGYKLFLVMNGFGDINATIDQNISSPLFAIDGHHYNTKYRSTYTKYFQNELRDKNRDYKQKEYLGGLFFFQNGELTKISKELPN